MRVAIRADASSKIGSGHVMRCLTLANFIKAKGGTCTFLARWMPDQLADLIVGQGHRLLTLPHPGVEWHPGLGDLAHSDWLGVTQELDASQVTEMLAPERFDWLIVDHYGLDWRWHKSAGSIARFVAQIDDLADRAFECDVLLDQNFIPDQDKRYQGLVPQKTIKFFGPKFALLQPEYLRSRARIEPRDRPIRSIVAYFGGGEHSKLASSLLNSFSLLREKHVLAEASLELILSRDSTLYDQLACVTSAPNGQIELIS